ncbi:MAG: hypothetical protein WBA16_06660 [Nonlabens sp.]
MKDPVESYFFRWYYFQYLPYRDKSGGKFIYVNAFCNEEFLHPVRLFDEQSEEVEELTFPWKEQVIEVADGGGCYWRLEVDLKTSSYFDLTINGNG